MFLDMLLGCYAGCVYKKEVSVEWKSTLLGVKIRITSFGVEIHAKNSRTRSQQSDSNHYSILWSGFHSFERGFQLQKQGDD